jgi:class 3 adenylate cyclase
MSETRKLAAILVADVVGYSRLAGADEDRILARLRTLRSDLIDPIISVHHGRIVKRTGDGSIIEFRSVVDAARCAIEVQSGMVERNGGLPPGGRLRACGQGGRREGGGPLTQSQAQGQMDVGTYAVLDGIRKAGLPEA